MFNDSYQRLPTETIRLSTGSGEKERVPMSSGLNWGQRPGREQNQAYIAISADTQRNGFFPETGSVFDIVTDDGQKWRCARRQANGKAIHTIDDNSIIGKYFRARLGVEPGGLVTLAHLINYGRTTIVFYRRTYSLYLLDFRV
jgi:hypothetical protein